MEGGESAFQRRSREVLERRKVSEESSEVIALSDQSTPTTQIEAQPQDAQESAPEAPVSHEAALEPVEPKRYFTLMPGEIPAASVGGDYVIDPHADPAAAGNFEYHGNVLRPVTDEEYREITAITADPATRAARGPRRLSTLVSTPQPTPAPEAAPQPAPVAQEAQPQVQKEDKATLLRRLDRNRFQLHEAHADNWKGGDNHGKENTYTHPDAPGQVFTQSEIDTLPQQRQQNNQQQVPQNEEHALRPGARDAIDRNRDEFAEDHRGVAPRTVQGSPRWRGLIQPLYTGRRKNALAYMHPGNAQREDTWTMDEILGDKRRGALFKELLQAHGRGELGERYMQARSTPEIMTPADWEELGAFRHEFRERMRLADEARAQISTERVAQMMTQTPAFAALSGNLSPERSAQIIGEYLPKFFMQLPERDIAAYVLGQRRLTQIESSTRFMETKQRVAQVCGRRGITAQQLEAEQIDRTVLKKMFNPGFLGFFSARTFSKRNAAMLREIDYHMDGASRILGFSLSRDRGLLMDIVREAAEGRRVPEIAHGEPTREEAAAQEAAAKKYYSAAAVLSQTKDNKFRARVARRYKVQSWDDLSPEQREDGTFAELGASREAPHKPHGHGWFSWIVGALFGTLEQNAKQQLRAQGAFA